MATLRLGGERFLGMVVLLGLGAGGPIAAAKARGDILAQRLVDELVAAHSGDLVSIGMHAKPPGSDDYVIVAHTKRTPVGKKSDEREDRAAIVEGKTGGPNLLADGVWDVTLPLSDSSGQPVGAVAIKVKPAPGTADPRGAALNLARRYRDALSGRIPSTDKLFERAR
jgi:hypothetical protein